MVIYIYIHKYCLYIHSNPNVLCIYIWANYHILLTHKAIKGDDFPYLNHDFPRLRENDVGIFSAYLSRFCCTGPCKLDFTSKQMLNEIDAISTNEYVWNSIFFQFFFLSLHGFLSKKRFYSWLIFLGLIWIPLGATDGRSNRRGGLRFGVWNIFYWPVRNR